MNRQTGISENITFPHFKLLTKQTVCRDFSANPLPHPPPPPQEDWMGKCLFLNHLTNYLEYNASKMLSKWGANAEKLDVENQPCWQIHRFLHYKVIHSSHQWWPIEVQSITESVLSKCMNNKEIQLNRLNAKEIRINTLNCMIFKLAHPKMLWISYFWLNYVFFKLYQWGTILFQNWIFDSFELLD